MPSPSTCQAFLGLQGALGLLKGCWLWPGCSFCSNQDLSLKGWAGALGRGLGLAPQTQYSRWKERRPPLSYLPLEGTCHLVVAAGPAGGISFILQLKCRGRAEGCAQRRGTRGESHESCARGAGTEHLSQRQDYPPERRVCGVSL